MAAKNLPDYRSWEALYKENYDHWDYFKGLFSYATQKPSNTLFTRRGYPQKYQLRLLQKEFYTNMQYLGQVTDEEVAQYKALTQDPDIKSAFNYHAYKRYSPRILLNQWGLFSWVSIAYFSRYVEKGTSWLIIPGLLSYLLCIGLQQRTLKMKIGDTVDLTNWVIENRKAQIWQAEQNGKFQSDVSYNSFFNQLKDISKFS